MKGTLNKINPKECWDGDAPEFVARFKNKAVTSIKEYQLLAKEVNLPFQIEERNNQGDREEYHLVVDKRNQHRQFYPKEDERKFMEEIVKPGTDLKSKMKEFAEAKEAALQEIVEEQKEIPTVKPVMKYRVKEEMQEAPKQTEVQQRDPITKPHEVKTPAQVAVAK